MSIKHSYWSNGVLCIVKVTDLLRIDITRIWELLYPDANLLILGYVSMETYNAMTDHVLYVRESINDVLHVREGLISWSRMIKSNKNKHT